ncbi:MAG: hypothetical protein Q9M94_05260 [Candidatus Gracilibacteria bacterium]|nr:hypothetical protein [Candidatus Gracilibacteria bacterium]
MKENEFQKLVLEQLGNLTKGQNILTNKVDNLDSRVGNIEKGQEKLNEKVGNLEKGQIGLQESLNRLENNFIDFKEETGENFEYTNKMINQAFENISENMEQKEKVDTIFNFLKKPKNNIKNTKIKQYNKRESILA